MIIGVLILINTSSTHAQSNNENLMQKATNNYYRIINHFKKDNKLAYYINYPNDKNPELTITYINSESMPHLIIADYQNKKTFDLTLFYEGILHNKGKEIAQKELTTINLNLEKVLNQYKL